MVVRKKSKFKRIFVRGKRRGRPKKKKSYMKLIIVLLIIFITIPSIVAYMWFKKNILDKVPDVAHIENIVFSQTTKITDRNGVLLYKVFNENRKYVGIQDISKTMQNAMVSTEDKDFWKNPGIDFKGIIRAGINDVVFGKGHGASTITQQLIKNLLLTNERTITRKLKEIVLAFQINDYLTKKINKQYKGLTQDQVKKKVKEKILEMYLNYVFFGNNAYGIQAASQTYFKKDAKSLDILESTILASIPKSPVNYDPITNRQNNLGELKAYSSSGDKLDLTGSFGGLIQDAYISYLNDQTFAILKDEQDIIKILSPDNLLYKKIHIKYISGRKDYVLARMYIDGYIDKTQFIQALKEGFDKKIYIPKVEIKAPHFVFAVLSNLEKKYGKDVIEKAGWTIKTSLDYDIQKMAEQSVSNWSGYLEKKGINNASLLYVDSTNGDILAYVGSQNYYNKKIDGQVDMITSKRQCGSVMKPLIYSNAFLQNKTFTPATPIYDTRFDIADKGHTFNNFDGKFLGILPLKNSLPYSRNIPASKMYFIGGGETKVKTFLRSIGLTTISDKIYYGYPLAIGAAEVTMLNMAQAYSNLSNINNPIKINPVLNITGPDGSIIYKKNPEKLKKIIPTGVISFLWYILSNSANRPPSWNAVMQIAGLKIATKSGTTNIIDPKTGRKYPRDGWFIAYTPSKVFISWAGNTKGEHMHSDAYGGWTAGKVWGDFVKKLKEKNLIKNEDMPLKGTTSIYVNSINGKKASNLTPVQISSKTIARTDGIPESDDGQTIKMMKVDTLCNGLVSKYTPKEDIKYAYVIKQTLSHRPNDGRWQEPVNAWWKNVGVKKYEKIFNTLVLLKEPTQICEERKIIAEKGELSFDIVYPTNNQSLTSVFDLRLKTENTPFKLDKIEIYLDNKLVQTSNYVNNIVGVYFKNDIELGNHNMVVKLIDEKGYSKSKNLTINIIKTDKKNPFLDEIKESGNKFIYIFKDENSRVLGGKLYCDGKEKRFRGPIAVGNSKDCKYDVIDYYGNMTKK